MNAQPTTTLRKVNWPVTIARVVTLMFMIGTAAISFRHIVTVSVALGLGWEAWTVPFLVDGIAVLGLAGRGKRFAKSTQRAGLLLVTVGGALSLFCNVQAGHNVGQKAYGVLIVGGFILTEWFATRLQPAPQPAQAVTGRRCEAGCGCGKHSPRKPAQRKPRARKAQARQPVTVPTATEWAAMPEAPVSPVA
jgi:hypothetical protein